MSAVDIGSVDDFVDGEPRAMTVNGASLVVVRVKEGIFVLEDRCSHEDFPLSLGEVSADGCEIECERHGAMFRLADGEPMSFPATRPVRHYPVSLVNDRVVLDMTS